MSTTTNRTQPVLLGGLVMGVLSALPIVNLGNVCCCLWVVSGGVLAAYLLQQSQEAPLTAADGALIGLLAGLAGAVINLVVSIPVSLLLAPFERMLLEGTAGMPGNMPPWIRDMIDTLQQERATGGIAFRLAGWMVSFVIMLIIGAVFSTLGGLLGAAIFRKPGTALVQPPTAGPSTS